MLPATAIYLRLEAPKSSYRRGSKVQHLKVDDPVAMDIIALAFSDLPDDALLFPLSPASYRFRFDRCLRTLDISSSCSLTPGGLRGGGAVAAYHRGITVPQIQWMMRLAHVHTLGHYLQEVAALASLNEASHEARQRVKTASELFPLLPYAET